MNQKKNKGLKIAIVIVLIIILILISIIAILYFSTDLLKTNKEAFFKYTAQLIEQEDGFIEGELTQYLEKKKNTPYENNGSIDFDISIPEMGQDNEALNNFNISFSGKTDKANSKNEQNISLNYSDDVKFPFYYKKVGDVQGIQTDNVGSKYIAKRDGEEIQSLEDMEINITGLEEISTIYNNIQISNEDIQNFKTKYFDNIFSQIKDDKFSKISEQNSTGYKLTLAEDELKEILIKIIETLKEDETTVDKLNQLLGLEQSASKIRNTDLDALINDITNNSKIGTLEVTVYNTNGKLIKIDVKHENLVLTIEKSKQENELTYNTNIEILQDSKQIFNTNIVAKYTGIQGENVIENYEITLGGNYSNNTNSNLNEQSSESSNEDLEQSSNEEPSNENNNSENIEYKYTINNTIQFVQGTDIQDFSTENAIILNDEDEEYVENLMKAVDERLILVNEEQMQQIGISGNQNPLIYSTPITLVELMIYNQASFAVQNSSMAVTEFNNKFTIYEGTSQKGVTVRGLLSTIKLNNEEENRNYEIKEIHFDGEEYEATDQNITLIKDTLEPETLYRVEFESDSDTGLIYRVVINKQ